MQVVFSLLVAIVFSSSNTNPCIVPASNPSDSLLSLWKIFSQCDNPKYNCPLPPYNRTCNHIESQVSNAILNPGKSVEFQCPKYFYGIYQIHWIPKHVNNMKEFLDSKPPIWMFAEESSDSFLVPLSRVKSSSVCILCIHPSELKIIQQIGLIKDQIVTTPENFLRSSLFHQLKKLSGGYSNIPPRFSTPNQKLLFEMQQKTILQKVNQLLWSKQSCFHIPQRPPVNSLSSSSESTTPLDIILLLPDGLAARQAFRSMPHFTSLLVNRLSADLKTSPMVSSFPEFETSLKYTPHLTKDQMLSKLRDSKTKSSKRGFLDSIQIRNDPVSGFTSFFFPNYHVVGQNSGPNQTPLFSGEPLESFDPGDRDSWLWKIFSKKSNYFVSDSVNCPRYYTSYAEDMCFQHSMLLRDMKIWSDTNSQFDSTFLEFFCHPDFTGKACFAGEPASTHLFQYLKAVQSLYKEFPKFSIAKFGESHEDSQTLVYSFDSEITDFLEWIEKSNPNAIVFVLSDHGLHYGLNFQKVKGQIDHKLPLLTLWTPTQLVQDCPEIQKILISNHDKFLTPYDMYNTILDVAQIRYNRSTNRYQCLLNTQDDIYHTFKTDRGLSLLSETIPNRSCEDLNNDFCVCNLL